MRWTVGIRLPGCDAWDLQPAAYPTMEAAEVACMMLLRAGLVDGKQYETAVFRDGEIDHWHRAPQRIGLASLR